MTADVQRDLGRAEGRLTALERDIGDIKAGMEKQDEKLARIESLLSEVKGGWRVLMAAGALGAAYTASFTPKVPALVNAGL
jgi:hypothetical protein